MKRLMDEAETPTADGLVVEDGGGPSLPGGPGGAAFPIVGVGASAGGLDAFTQLLKHLPADSGMAFVLIQHLDPTHASFLRDALAKATPMTVSRGRGRHRRRAQPRLRDPARRGHRDQPRPADSRVARARRPTVAPVRRRLPPLARRRPRQPRDRRRAFGKRVRRHGGFAGHQGRERHHLRAGSGVGEVRRDAAQRGQRRRRRRRAGDSRPRPRAGAPEPPPLRGSRRGPTGGRRRGRPRSDPDGRAQRHRRRLQRVQAGDGGAPAGAQDGASPRAGSAGLPGDRCKGIPRRRAPSTRTSSFTSPRSSGIRPCSRRWHRRSCPPS